jgi:hypothetical protein
MSNPRGQEMANPLEFADAMERSPMEAAPAGAVVESITAVCTIEGLDRPTETVTLMGPLGGALGGAPTKGDPILQHTLEPVILRPPGNDRSPGVEGVDAPHFIGG